MNNWIKENKIFIIIFLISLVILLAIVIFCSLEANNLKDIYYDNANKWLTENPTKNWNEWEKLTRREQFSEKGFVFYGIYYFLLVPAFPIFLVITIVFLSIIIMQIKDCYINKKLNFSIQN